MHLPSEHSLHARLLIMVAKHEHRGRNTMNSVNSTDVAVIVWDGWDVAMLGIMCIIIVIACKFRPGRGGVFRAAST